MEKSASTIGRRTFCRLSARRQHRLLAELAETAARTGAASAFAQRYEELHTWASLDRYAPPAWLSPAEMLEECACFHRLQAGLGDAAGDRAVAAPAVSWQPTLPVTVALDQVRSPYNVGSILRLIDNAGFAGLVHSSPWLRLDHPRLQRAARGTQQWVPVRYESDLPGFLAHATVPVIGIETGPSAIPLDRWDPPRACVLLVGNESYGIAGALRRRCTAQVAVPMRGYKASMNVHHALAVVAWRICERHAA